MSTFDSLLSHCTVHLVGLKAGKPYSTGTGFYYFFNDTFTDENGDLNEDGTARIGIVTNKHVVEGIDEVIFHFNATREGQKKYETDKLRMSLNTQTIIPHPEANIDLCVILTDSLFQTMRLKKQKIHLYPVRKNIRRDENKYKEMETIQNLIMIGYPRGIWDSVNNLPIIRSGINATPLYEDYQGTPCFAVDIASYPGSSGSPVFIYDKGFYLENNQIIPGNRLIFIGVISSGHVNNIVSTEELTIQEMLHVGIAIKASQLDVFEDLIEQHYEG